MINVFYFEPMYPFDCLFSCCYQLIFPTFSHLLIHFFAHLFCYSLMFGFFVHRIQTILKKKKTQARNLRRAGAETHPTHGSWTPSRKVSKGTGKGSLAEKEERGPSEKGRFLGGREGVGGRERREAEEERKTLKTQKKTHWKRKQH